MIPSTNIVAFGIALVLTTTVPIVLVIALAVKKRVSGFPLLLGAAAFFVSQILIRLPLMGWLASFTWYQQFAGMLVPFIIVTGLTAGLFEESARLGGALILKRKGGHAAALSFRDIVSFGLGHGLCEVIMIVGMAHVNNVLFSLAINSGVETAITNSLPPETLAALTERLAAATALDISLGLLERVGAVLFHVFATYLIFKGVIVYHKLAYWALAVLAHGILNAITLFIFRGLGALPALIFVLIMGMACGWYVWKQHNDPLLNMPPKVLPNVQISTYFPGAQ